MPARKSERLGLLLLIVGCAGPSSPPSPAGVLRAPAQINFGNLALGQSVQALVPLTNVGAATLKITGQAISGGPFSEQTPLLTSQLAPGASTRAIVAFSPTDAGAASGTLTFTGNGEPEVVTVVLSGVGLDLGVSASPSALDFGDVAVGTSPSPAETVTLTNPSAAPIDVTLVAGSASQYTLLDPAGNPIHPVPVELQPDVPYVVTVLFAPDAAAVFDSFFTVTPCLDSSGSSCVSPMTVTLSGRGTSGEVAFSPSPIVVDLDGGAVTVTVTNVGTATATVTCLYLQSLGAAACGRSSSEVSLGAELEALPAVLSVGESFTLAVNGGGSDVLAAAFLPEGLPIQSIATDEIEVR